MKKLTFISIISLVLGSCVFIRMDDSIDMGNHFRYIQDSPKTIIYHDTEKYEGVGDIIVSPILAYNFNDRYIIAKSSNEGSVKKDSLHSVLYWIIDKKEELNLVQSMDSVNFYQRLKDLKIQLVFK